MIDVEEQLGKDFDELCCRLVLQANSALGCKEDIEDIVQEALLSVYKSYNPEHESQATVTTFAYKDCYYKIQYFLRKKQTELKVQEVLSNSWEVTCDQMGRAPYDKDRLDYAERQELMELLILTINQLSLNHREVVVWVFFEDLSYEEVGKKLNRSQNYVKVLVYRIRNRLKKLAVETGLADYLQ